MDGSTAPWLLWALCSSLALHGVGYASIERPPRALNTPRPRSEVRIQVVTPVARAEEPPAPPAPEPAPQRAPEPAPAPPRAETQTTPEPVDPAPAQAALDLSGVTLTNESSSTGFSAAAGNGLARSGALTAPAASARARPATTPATAEGPLLVAFSDLSSRPQPPPLESALRTHYPEDARRRGVAGSAQVRARVDADGVVRRIDSLDESFPGFGEACRRTLRGSRWSPPRDRGGRAVATEVRYTCRFVVLP